MTALGYIDATNVAAAKVPGLEKQVKDQGDKLDAQEHASLVAQLKGAGKLTAHMEAMASEMTLAQLKSFAAKDPKPIPHLVATAPEETETPNAVTSLTYNGKTWGEMTFPEKHALHDANPVLFAAMKADFDSRKAA